ncbi:ASCH domain-containing protein [Shewanella baltica]|uniref:ASCH domain-containing protein n=1 Tax=Shewanella baltica TaxID=62322 RepID=UPI0039AECE1A
MKQRPIIFNTEMVQAIVDGRKTQTRRALRVQPHVMDTIVGDRLVIKDPLNVDTYLDFINAKSTSRITRNCQFGEVGDQLYVRETFADSGSRLTYKADKDDGAHCVVKRWTPSIHMPRSCARIILEVTNVRVEKVQHISERDAWAEGFEGYDDDVTGGKSGYSEFCEAWQSIYGEQSWQSNPWVWVIEFKVISTTGGAA